MLAGVEIYVYLCGNNIYAGAGASLAKKEKKRS